MSEDQRRDDFPLQRQIFNLESKIDKVDGKIDTLTAVLGEQWKGLEGRFMMSIGQVEQTLKMLTDNVVELRGSTERLKTDQSALETQLALTDGTQKNMQTEIKDMRANLRWGARALALVAVGLVVDIIKTQL